MAIYFRTLVKSGRIDRAFAFSRNQVPHLLLLKGQQLEVFEIRGDEDRMAPVAYRDFDRRILDTVVLADGHTIACVGSDYQLKLLSVDGLRVQKEIGLKSYANYLSPCRLVAHPTKLTFACFAYQRNIIVFDVVGDEVTMKSVSLGDNETIQCCTFLSDDAGGFSLVVGIFSSRVRRHLLKIFSLSGDSYHETVSLELPGIMQSDILLGMAQIHAGRCILVAERVCCVFDIRGCDILPLPDGVHFKCISSKTLDGKLMCVSDNQVLFISPNADGFEFSRWLMANDGIISEIGICELVTGDVFFVASDCGNGGLFKRGTESNLVPVSSLTSLAPVLDLDTQPTKDGIFSLVACSGYRKEGSIYSIRSGIGAEVTSSSASADFVGSSALWLWKLGEIEYIAVAITEQTYIFSLEHGELEDVTAKNEKLFVVTKPSLLFHQWDDYVLQVCASEVRVVKADLGLCGIFKAPGRISVAVAHSNLLCIALAQSRRVVSVEIRGLGANVVFQEYEIDVLDSEVSSIAFNGSLCCIGTFDFELFLSQRKQTGIFEQVDCIRYSSRSVPESIQFLDGVVCLIGLRDGCLLEYQVKDLKFDLVETKRIGRFPVKFVATERAFLALSDRTWRIYLDQKRLNLQAIDLEAVTAAVRHNTGQDLDEFIIIKDGYLQFVTFEKAGFSKKRMASLQSPRRLLISQQQDQIALISSDHNIVSAIKEDWSVSRFAQVLLPGETALALQSTLFRLAPCIKMIEWMANRGCLVILSTSFRVGDQMKGRVVVLSLGNGEPNVLTRQEFMSPVICCLPISDIYLVIAHGRNISLLELGDSVTSSSTLVALESLRWPITCMASNSNLLAVGSEFDGISLFRFNWIDKRLEFVASDRYSNTPMACEFFGTSNTILVLDRSGMLFTISADVPSESTSAEQSLKRTGAFPLEHIGRRMHRVRLKQDDGSTKEVILLGSFEGAILAVAEVATKSDCAILEQVQHAIFNGINELYSYTRMYGIINGDRIAQFLELPPSEQKELVMRNETVDISLEDLITVSKAIKLFV